MFPNQPALPLTTWDDRCPDETVTGELLSDLISQHFEDSAHPPILNPHHPQHQTKALPFQWTIAQTWTLCSSLAVIRLPESGRLPTAPPDEPHPRRITPRAGQTGSIQLV